MTKRIIILTRNSAYLAEQYSDGRATIVDRGSFESPFMDRERRYSGPVINNEGRPVVGRSMTFEDPYIGSVSATEVERIIDVDEPTSKNVLTEFDASAALIKGLGRRIGFEGISKVRGMDSVDAMLADIRRVIA